MNDASTTKPARGLWEDTAPPSPATEELQESVDADVAVIGAGYTGLSTALHLALAGSSVAVLEAVDIGFGGSGRNVGLVNAGLWISPDQVSATLGPAHGERLLDFLGAAPALVFDLIGRHGIECEAERRGTLHCAVDRKGVADLESRARQWRARGAPVELLSGRDTACKLGTEHYVGSLWDHRAGTLQPLAYARGLARAAIDAGARIFTRSPVLRADGGAPWVLHGEHGSVRASWVVVATDAYGTGPWAEIAAEQVNLPYFNFCTPPLDPKLKAAILPERQGAWDTRTVLSSFRLDRSGRLIFGSVGALEGGGAAVHGDWARRALRRIFPQLDGVEFQRGWYGNIGMTADRLPRFHRLAPNVVAFCGYNGRGIAPGTVFGKVLAEHILGKISEADLPLPPAPVRTQRLRAFKESFYRVGAQLAHWSHARF